MSSSEPIQPCVGTRLGPYTLVEPIGMGGMARVFRAEHDDGHVVAIKVLHSDALQTEERARFEREFETLKGLSHPNVVAVHEAGVSGGTPWLAMEFVAGEDLAQTVREWEVPPGPERMPVIEGIVRGLCEGLAYIHDRGLIHRDLKPGNILMTRDGVPKISDFGVVKDPDAAHTALTVVGKLVGTVAFMAPEQITNEPVDARTDLYSLGALLFLLLTGRRPIEATSVAGYLARHLTEVPKTANHYNPTVPPRLSQLCARLLAKDPAERPPSARDALAMLDDASRERAMPIRGRDAILAPIVQALRADHSVVCALVGPPGSGRSCLLSEVARIARGLGLTVQTWSHTKEWPDLDADVVLIDDAERLSNEALATLSRSLETREAPLTLVTASTTARRLTAALDDRLAEPIPVIPLVPLERPDVIGMMRDRGLAGPVAPALGRRLHADFSGLPGPIHDQVMALIREGWLSRDGDRYRAARDLDDFRNADLPVPAAIRSRLQSLIGSLHADAHNVLNLLTVLDRPASEELIARCTSEEGGRRGVQHLVDSGLALRRGEDGRLRLAHPATSTVVRSRLDADTTRSIAATLAGALQQRRRRADAQEVARMWMVAGDRASAYPHWLRAARRAARDGRSAEVLNMAARAAECQKAAESGMTSEAAIRARRWLYLLEGEAHLARGSWSDAVRPLTNAVAAARLEDDPSAIARALTSLGRAHYRRGAWDDAKPHLEEALNTFDPSDPLRASAIRALADIRLRHGDLRGAEAMWSDALDAARLSDSSDAQSRAIRGLANVRALQNRLDAAASLLESALDRLERGGDVRVLCSVLGRAVELDLAAGRLGAANHRVERLLERVQTHELADRLADAHALHAIVLVDSGNSAAAETAAKTALTYAGIQGDQAWNTRLRIARAQLATGQLERAASALPDPDRLPDNRIEDPRGQLAAIRARLLAPTNPAAAKDLALWAITRGEPLLSLRAFRIRVDGSRALAQVGEIEQAREAAKRAIRLLDAAGTEGFRLDGLLALHQAANDPRVAGAIRQLAERIAGRLPPDIAASFRTRRDLVAAGVFTP